MKQSLRVLLVPDYVHWVTGTIAKAIVRFNPWIEGTIVSGQVLDVVLEQHPEMMSQFDLVHFVCPYASKQWLPRFQKIMPCVTSHHHVTQWELVKHNLEGDMVVVGSDEWGADLKQRGFPADRVARVPYGVDATRFTPPSPKDRSEVRRELKIPDDSIVVGFFGKQSSNDDDRKGIGVFSEAIVNLSREMPKLTAFIIGPGWQDFVESLRGKGIHCVWLPFIRDNEGLARMYGALDFYWVTAKVEGGPVTLLEAMSSEVCCISTPVGLARDLVEDGTNAMMVPIGDAAGFVQRTAELASKEDKRKRLGCNARVTILQKMHVGVAVRQFLDVYRRAFEVFALRNPNAVTPRMASLDFDQMAKQWKDEVDISTVAVKKHKVERVPLKGFSPSIQKQISLLENLDWAEALVLQNQRATALKMICQEWASHPFSSLPSRRLLRLFLPLSFVTRMVKWKHSVQGLGRPRTLPD